MVRLKVGDWVGHDIDTLKFQFHYGSVKSLLELMPLLPPKKFQFHYGSVKSKTWFTT